MTLFEVDERAEAIAAADGIVDLFGGPGGWDVALEQFGLRAVGVEFDRWACATRRAAGHPTVEADVAHQHPADYAPCRGLIASPPCQALSSAGRKHGRTHLEVLADAIRGGAWSVRPDSDPRVWLSLEVGRWCEQLAPEWVALEQVPAALPLWEAYAAWLTGRGYSVWCGTINAADYGVPQIRQRAVLIASRTRLVHAPVRTHHREGESVGRLPWVTMAAALGWCDGRVGFPRRDDRGDSVDGYRERDMRTVDEPAFTLTEKARSWSLRTGTNTEHADGVHPYERDVDRPSGTVTQQARQWAVDTGRDWKIHEDGTTTSQQFDPFDTPAFTSKSGGQWQLLTPGAEPVDNPVEYDPTLWTHDRPATTIAGDPRVFHPGSHRANDGRDNERAIGRSEHAIRVEVPDALVLQSFPADYPVQGGRSVQFEQIGNAVPPLMAAACLRVVLC